MTPDKYQILSGRTDQDRTQRVVDKLLENQPNGSWLLHSLIGVAGECGEFAAAIQRWLYYGKELNTANVKEELGDLMWYIAQACRALNITIEDLMTSNLNKLKFRYPERYTDFHAAEENRNRELERAILEEVETPIVKAAKERIPKILGFQAKIDEANKILAAEAYQESCMEAMASEPYDLIREQTGKFCKQITCPNCKTPLSDRAVICPECETKLRNS